MDQLKALSEIMLMAGAGYWEYFPQKDRVRLSAEMLALIGISEAEAPDTIKDCEKWIHPDDWKRFVSRADALASGDERRCETDYRICCRDGSVKWLSERCFILRRDENGAVETVGGILYETYAPDRELQEAKVRVSTQYGLLRAVNTVAALLLGDYEGDFNKVVAEALGVLGDSVQVHRAYVWKNSTIDGRLYCQRLAEWEADENIRQEGESGLVPYDEFIPDLDKLLVSQGELLVWMDEMGDALSGFPGIDGVVTLLAMPVMLYGEFWGFVGFDDMREKRSFTPAQLNILKSGGMLIASGIMRSEMIDSLIEAREEALSSMNAKSEFLSRMSHEIRTPMNAIIGMNEIAKSSDDPQRVKYCLARIEQASHQLLGLINDILDLSKIESGKMEINCAEFDFERMLQNAYAVVQPRVDEKGIKFSFDLDAHYDRYVMSDELRLTQVIVNLLSNAVKFTPQDGGVTLRVRIAEQSGSDARLCVEVQDTGIGIGKQEQEKLFQPFEQADGSITRRFGGTGLGLSICRNIIDLMSGKICVESEPGEGSRFIFEVPVQLGGLCTPHQQNLPNLKNMRVLVVDDDTDVLDYCRQIISGFQMHCDTADSGEEALALVSQAALPYNIIFVDWEMPGLDGIQTAGAIQKLVSSETIVIMISVADWSDLRTQAAEIGVTKFLAKPILPSVLFNTIAETIGSANVYDKETELNYEWPGKTLLMADDIEINQEIVRTLLENTGVSIECAKNGIQALEIYCASPERYDLVLMDVQMPEMDGYEATRRLRASGCANAENIPILAMTADAFSEDVERCIAAGMNGHISKPINVRELMEKLDLVLG